ncbi:hypothetical protein [Cobetia sp. QF-1]|uniref:hypothetical protein n=1 Tax=Cobetia sp. QF-1 TaxID=1969833 RepID=UPI000B53F6CC|nr:hypothetical protein [Cobetia sp. QF-1]
MSDEYNEFFIKNINLNNAYRDLADSLKNISLPNDMIDMLSRLDRTFDRISSLENNDNTDFGDLVKYAKNASIYATNIGGDVLKLNNMPIAVKEKGEVLANNAVELKKHIDTFKFDYNKINNSSGSKEYENYELKNMPNNIDNNFFNKFGEDVNEANRKVRELSSKIDDALADQENKLKNISLSASSLDSKINNQINNAQELYEYSKNYLEGKNQEVNALIEIISEKSLVSGFQKSASSERFAAETLRVLSVIFMTSMVGVVGYSFWETVTSTFDWQVSVFRLLLVTVLSIPSAYLAKESAKHRAQQYLYQQTSLELQALPLYIASLPDEFQYIIKADAASKLFSGKNSGNNSEEAFPINTQELMLKLLEVVQSKNK